MASTRSAPYFSIIIPAYNRADVIGDAIRSCQAQTFGDFEIIVVDDGSADGEALRATLEAIGDERIALHRQENAGASAARNTGMDIAKGRYFAFLDSDDQFLPGKLERFHEAIAGRDRFAGFAPAIVDRGEGRTALKPSKPLRPGEKLENYFFARNQMVQTSVLVTDRKSALDARFMPDILVGEDLDFCLAVEAAGIPWEMIDEPLSIWSDIPKAGRSAEYRGDMKGGYRSFRTWQLLSERGRHAYEGTVGAFHTAPFEKSKALAMLLKGPVKGGVELKVTARQFMRSFLPRSTYHKLVAGVLDVARQFRGKAGGK